MKVYIINEICDYEYFCRETIAVTLDEQVAKDYCKKYSKKDIGWDEIERDTIIYEERETLDNTNKKIGL